MTRRDEQRIADILDAAAELQLIVERGRAAFDADVILRRAAERLLAHQYHRVDPDQVWTIAADHVPVLVDALAAG